MKKFADLIILLATGTKTNAKLAAIGEFLASATPSDRVWMIALFSGRRPRQAVKSQLLRDWCMEAAGIEPWLFEESYHTVGDLAETISLLLPDGFIDQNNNAVVPARVLTSDSTVASARVLTSDSSVASARVLTSDSSVASARVLTSDSSVAPARVLTSDSTVASARVLTSDSIDHSLTHYMDIVRNLAPQSDDIKKDFVLKGWREMNRKEIFVFNKLMTGNFRIGVSQKLMVNAIAKQSNIDEAVVAHRIMGDWDPAVIEYDDLISSEHVSADTSKPYPFYLAYAIEGDVADLGDPADWQAEWKWDGIRGQIIKRNNEFFVWSRGEELMTDKFPEYKLLENLMDNGTVIDGEIITLAFHGADSPSTLRERGSGGEVEPKPLPFSFLQTRIGRKNITAKQLKEAPVGFIAYDLLEENGEDIREKPMSERRERMLQVVKKLNVGFVVPSPVIHFASWDELKTIREGSRDKGSEGIMLKRKSSEYRTGRKRGDWWKWKIDPLTIDAVMVYAQKGTGRRSNLYTDYTFAVRDGDKLVTFAKAYSGLTDKEFARVDNFVKRNSLEKFGPVRTVKPELVFELAFEGIAESKRHKSGVALRFPRMLRWREDKKVDEINTLDDLKAILRNYNEQYKP